MKTHCCFCGQQCGIQLKVRDNQVIGFEPWEEFPFNRGMLCPKGVKRYLQGGHPDRLLDPLMRTDRRLPHGDLGRGARLHRAPAARDPGEVRQGRRRGLRRRLADHREGVPARQVRARGARHAAHRLQRPALHGLGRHRLQAGVRRRPLARIPGATSRRPRSLLVIGANIGECAPITTDYIWRCRDHGGKLIVVDPRMTPITRNADLYLPVRPGTDLALLMGMLHVILRDGLEDRDVHRRAHHRLRGGRGIGRSRRTRGAAAERDRRAAGGDREGRALVREAPSARSRCTRAGSSTSRKGVENCSALINLVPGHRQHRPRGRGLHDDHRPGQRPGRPRARPEVRSAARPALHHRPGGARARRQGLGHLARRDSAGRATPPWRS